MSTPKRYTVTSALPYANGPLHLGHLRNNFLGFSSSFTTVLFSFEDAERESNSVCEIEKKATSVPETKAEQSNKKSNAQTLELE